MLHCCNGLTRQRAHFCTNVTSVGLRPSAFPGLIVISRQKSSAKGTPAPLRIKFGRNLTARREDQLTNHGPAQPANENAAKAHLSITTAPSSQRSRSSPPMFTSWLAASLRRTRSNSAMLSSLATCSGYASW